MTRSATTGNPLWWLPTGLMMGLIWFLSSRSDPIGIPLPHPLDWIAHFGSYAILGFCAARVCGSWITGWVLAAWFGAFDEVHQAFVPGREAGIGDWWFDLLGAWLGSRLGAFGLSGVKLPRSTQSRSEQSKNSGPQH